MTRYLCFLLILIVPTSAIATEEVCDISSFNEVLSYYFSDEFKELNSRILEVHYKNYSSTDKFLDLIVVAQEGLRGGSASLVTIDVFKGAKGGLCSLPVTLDLNMQISEPYEINIGASEYYPVFDIEYTYFADNSLGTFKTDSLFVSDLRTEQYEFRDGKYEATDRKVLNCFVCAPEK